MAFIARDPPALGQRVMALRCSMVDTNTCLHVLENIFVNYCWQLHMRISCRLPVTGCLAEFINAVELSLSASAHN